MVNTREIAAEYRLSHWAQIMQERVQSGLSIKAFCGQIGICHNTYFYWQRKLREAACRELMVNPQNETAITRKPPVPSGWAVCETSKAADKVKALPIEINGCRVLADTDVDPDLLSKVCRVLKSLC
jgi:putative transposase